MLYFVFSALLALALSSSHSEAPGTAVAPGADITDLYAFKSYEPGREDTVTFIINSSPLQSPFAGPNYYGFSSQHFYQLVIHENDDTPCSQEEHVFSFFFGAKLGGGNGNVEEIIPNFCNQTLQFNTMVNVPEGITVPIEDADGNELSRQFIPLKAGGSAAAGGAFAAQNYFEFMHVDYATAIGTDPSVRDVIARNLTVPFPNAGEKTFLAGYDDYLAGNNNFVHTVDLPTAFCAGEQARIFAGQRAESFSVNLGNIFDLVNMNPIPGFGSSVRDDDRNNQLRDKNVQTIAIEIPSSCFDNGLIGVWARASTLYHDAADAHFEGVQTSRLGNPLVNEVVIGLKDKNIFTAAHPKDDADKFGTYVFNPSLPSLINILFKEFVNTRVPGGRDIANLAPNNIPRDDLRLIFLEGLPNLNGFRNVSEKCEMMRLNLAVPAVPAADQRNDGVLSLDTAGMPNGRRPGDDAVDIALRAVMGRVCSACAVFSEALGLGERGVCDGVCDETNAPVGHVEFMDGAPQNARQFGTEFPYLNPPYEGTTRNIQRNTGSASTSPAAAIPNLF